MAKDTLVCLKRFSESDRCYNNKFHVKRTNNGLITICTHCGAEQNVRDINVANQVQVKEN
jgi:hypothetical protein